VSDSPPDPVAERIVAEATAAAREDEAVLGLMIKGSLARGERYPGADIDLHALVTPGAGRSTDVRMVEGVMVETAYWDETKFTLRLEEQPATAYGLVEARILLDTDGRLAHLRAEATHALERYRPTADELAGVMHWLRSALVKISATRLAGDPARLGLIVSLNLHEVLRWLFLVNHRPMPPQGSVLTHLGHLEAVPPGFPELVLTLTTGSAEERADAMLRLLEWLEPRLESMTP
jgi:hypothetical protein